jgi:hypothetical protein
VVVYGADPADRRIVIYFTDPDLPSSALPVETARFMAKSSFHDNDIQLGLLPGR